MTDFGDDLRAILAKKKEQFFVREMQEERQRQAANRLRDDTRRAAARLAREVFLPLLEEFREVMEAAGVLCGGSVEEAPCPAPPTPHSPLPTSHSVGFRLRAAGTAPQSPHVEIRIAAAASDDGGIEVSVECLDTTAAEFGAGVPPLGGGEEMPAKAGTPARTAQRPLVELPPKTFKAAAIHDDAVRQWCAGLLKKCGEACLDANRKKA